MKHQSLLPKSQHHFYRIGNFIDSASREIIEFFTFRQPPSNHWVELGCHETILFVRTKKLPQLDYESRVLSIQQEASEKFQSYKVNDVYGHFQIKRAERNEIIACGYLSNTFISVMQRRLEKQEWKTRRGQQDRYFSINLFSSHLRPFYELNCKRRLFTRQAQ